MFPSVEGVTQPTGTVALRAMICCVKALLGICLRGANGKAWLSSGFPTSRYSNLEGSTSSRVEEAEVGSQNQSSLIAHTNHLTAIASLGSIAADSLKGSYINNPSNAVFARSA